jgi:hypothetical protein
MAATKNIKKTDGTQTVFGANHKVVDNIAAPKKAAIGIPSLTPPAPPTASERLAALEAKDHEFKLASLADAYRHADGSYRWGKNDHVPPADFIAAWLKAGKISEQHARTSKKVRIAMNKKAIEEYAAHRAEHGYSDEEMFEMRIAFGPEADIVDVLTGHRMRLPSNR